MDEQADKIATKHQKTSHQMKSSIIQDYKRSRDALEKCKLCYDDTHTPRIPIVAMGVKTYLAIPDYPPMVPFHCFIVPIQHVTTTLECDDDVWDEIRVCLR